MKIPLNWLTSYVKIPKDTKELTNALTMAGHMLDKIESIKGDTVIDLELRGNRADCYSVMGIAREVSALFKTPLLPLKVNETIRKSSRTPGFNLKINSPYVKRVMAVVLKDVKITNSPAWLSDRLAVYGIPAINNIVDLTNYVMLETGEPMHAFDLEKAGKDLEIRLAKKGETITTFMGQEIPLTADDLIWANPKSVLSVAGAIGGKFHGVSESTKTVLLEAASYDRANIRRTIYRHNILTDAGIRHEKELDPNFVEQAIRRYLEIFTENGWGRAELQALDYYPSPLKPWKLQLSYEFLAKLGGVSIEAKRVKEILTWLNFKVVRETQDGIQVLVPTYRTDVTMDEDLVEEILRIEGYDKIPAKTLSLEIPKDVTPGYISQETETKNRLLALGFDEIITSPFVAVKNLAINRPNADKGEAVRVVNFPSPDTEVLRTSLLPNLLEATTKIINERGEAARLFEVGRIYLKSAGKYAEKRKVGLIYWEKTGGSFEKFKGLLEGFLALAGVSNYAVFSLFDTPSSLLNAYKIAVGANIVGTGGMIGATYYAEFDLDLLREKEKKVGVSLWPKYPPQIEDITVTVPAQTHIGEIVTEIKKPSHVENTELTKVYDNAYTFRIWYQARNKTLTDKEVAEVRSEILNSLEKKFGVRIKG